jgi:sugar lactone lactonase YvrE
MKRFIGAFTATTLVLSFAFAGSAIAKPFPDSITMPGATSAEGVATGAGSSFYAGDLFKGDIYRGDIRAGTAALFIDAPDGRMALGMKVDVANDLLVVAGGPTGQGYVYDASTGEDVATLQLSDPGQGATFINDVTIAGGAAWFTDSARPNLYRVPIGAGGSVGAPSTLTLSGPAANLTGAFNLNGIAATPNGAKLLVAHSADGTVYTVDPATGASAAIAGADVPNVDGILFEAGRLWAVQNNDNQVTQLRLSPDLSSATVERVITNSDVNGLFEIPTTVARAGSRLVVVNAKFDTGFPPTAPSFEVVIVDRGL